VFDGKCVICLDELDKLNDVDELEDLLRGIKGILGRRDTHFLLTVSEDAVAHFLARRHGDRGMIESAFEDVLSLERVDLITASRILGQMSTKQSDGINSRQKNEVINGALFWLFGTGVPREIKRNILICEQTGLNSMSAPLDIWRTLTKAFILSLTDWTFLVGQDDKYSNALAKWSDKIADMLQNSANGITTEKAARDWCVKAANLLFEEYPVLSRQRSEGLQYEETNDERFSRQFERASIETLICLTGVIFTADGGAPLLNVDAVKSLTQIFQSLPTNLPFAWAKVNDYSASLGLAL
jgi:hypothetical protein